jgi:hypothetical protein
LNTGEVAIVKQINHAPLTPVVLLVTSAGNTLLSKPHELDLSQVETLHRSITAVRDPQQTGIDPTLYLDKKPS